MTKVNVAQAKANLSSLIERVLAGEEVVIARRNRPLVRLSALESARPKRSLGWAKGLIEMSPDFDESPPDFDDYSRP